MQYGVLVMGLPRGRRAGPRAGASVLVVGRGGGVPPDLVLVLVAVESSWRCWSVSTSRIPWGVVSRTGVVYGGRATPYEGPVESRRSAWARPIRRRTSSRGMAQLLGEATGARAGAGLAAHRERDAR